MVSIVCLCNMHILVYRLSKTYINAKRFEKKHYKQQLNHDVCRAFLVNINYLIYYLIIFINILYWYVFKNLPLGMPQGPGVLLVSRKSRSYVRAGGNVRATWLVVLYTRQATMAKTNAQELKFIMNVVTYNLNYF